MKHLQLSKLLLLANLASKLGFIIIMIFFSSFVSADALMDLVRHQQKKLPPLKKQVVVQKYSSTYDPIATLLQSLYAQESSDTGLNTQPIKNNTLKLDSQVVLIMQDNKPIYSKNANKVMPIASITKIMSAMVFLDAKQKLDQKIKITKADIDTLKHSSSRLSVGTVLSRKTLLHLALMSSENRAIHALARNYPGGVKKFVKSMNAKAKKLHMAHTTFYDPTGLNPNNRSTATDLVKMFQTAYTYPLIRLFSTANGLSVLTAHKKVQYYKSSNALIREGIYPIELQKTGYIRESGKSMVLQMSINKKTYIFVLLDSPSSYSRTSDAKEVYSWLHTQNKKDNNK